MNQSQASSNDRRAIPWQMRLDFARNPMRRFVSNGKVHVFWTPDDWSILTSRALRMYVQELKAAQEVTP